MRVCSRCGKRKLDKNFNFKNKLKKIRQYHCKECSRLYVRQHYEKNKRYYLQKAYKRNQKNRYEIRRYVWNYLCNHSCVDCGERDPNVLEFDHIGTKSAMISEMHRNYTLKKVIQEISKCQVRCANCHRRKTARERNWNKRFRAPVA